MGLLRYSCCQQGEEVGLLFADKGQPSACMRSEGYSTWFVSMYVCLSVCLLVCQSVCYHVLCTTHNEQQGNNNKKLQCYFGSERGNKQISSGLHRPDPLALYTLAFTSYVKNIYSTTFRAVNGMCSQCRPAFWDPKNSQVARYIYFECMSPCANKQIINTHKVITSCTKTPKENPEGMCRTYTQVHQPLIPLFGASPKCFKKIRYNTVLFTGYKKFNVFPMEK